MSLFRSFLLLGVAGLSLAGCGELREDLGFGRNSPDEFAVVDRPPLSMPPDYSLRPPQPGMPRPQDIDADQQASEALFGSVSTVQHVSPSDSEKALMDSLGVDKADPAIRAVVDRETAQKAAPSDHLVRRLLDWKSEEQKTGTVIDPAGEAERLKKAQESGEPVTSGATPIIEKRESGWLGL